MSGEFFFGEIDMCNNIDEYSDVLSFLDNIEGTNNKTTNEPLLTCIECGKLFTTVNGLLEHIKYHQIGYHSCNTCGKIFNSVSSLLFHIVTHYDDDICSCDTRYKCHICPSSFAVKGSLTQHLLTHVDASKVTCTICNNQFSSVNSLKTHMDDIHDIPRTLTRRRRTIKRIREDEDVGYHLGKRIKL